MLRKILVPVDTLKRENTRNAIENAMELSRGCSIDWEEPVLVLLHVLHSGSRVPMEEAKKVGEVNKERVEREFEEIKEWGEEKGLNDIKTMVVEGKPEEEIVKAAQDEEIDLIVMGSGKLHDRTTKGKINKFFYGSVTEKVLHEAPCSVFVSRS